MLKACFGRQKHCNLYFTACLFLLIGSTAHAQVQSTIQTPPAAAIASLSDEKSLSDLALANLVASNCKIDGLSHGDTGLVAGTAQAVASHLNLSMDDYFASYVRPAMMKLTNPDACLDHAPMTISMVEKLKELGGRVLAE